MRILPFLLSAIAISGCSELVNQDNQLQDIVSTEDGQYDPLPYDEKMAQDGYKPVSSLGLTSQELEAVPLASTIQMRVGAGKGFDLACVVSRENDLTAYGSVTAKSGRQYVVVGLSKPCIAQVTPTSAQLTSGQNNSQSYSLAEGYVLASEVKISAYSIADAKAEESDIPTIEGKSSDGSGCSSIRLTKNGSDVRSVNGPKWRTGDVPGYSVEIQGDASKWEVSLGGVGNLRTNDGKRVDYGRNFLRKSSSGNGTPTDLPSKVFEGSKKSIGFSEFISVNNWFRSQIKISVQGKSGDSDIGNVCEAELKIQSPIILSFQGEDKPSTISVFDSKVRFDLDADGIKEQVGWVSGKYGFLVLDSNGNGLIDNGSELFGEHSHYQSFSNGYLPLAKYDQNSDSVITSKDAIFSKLQLWFDENQDGVSQTSELKTLDQMEVTSISTNYQTLDYDNQLLENQVRYASRFDAKGCPDSGCRSFDVFFGSIQSSSSMVEVK